MGRGKAPHKGNHAKLIVAQERASKAMELRLAGKPYQCIADMLGASLSTIRRDVNKLLDEMSEKSREHAERYRVMEDQRLDMISSVLYDQVLDGNLEAIDRYLRVMSRRAKLWGLDAPTKNISMSIPLSAEQVKSEIEQRFKVIEGNFEEKKDNEE